MNEPYLQAFRTPRLVGDLIVERLPLIAAVKSLDFEPFSKPWRLVYLGDPLYRLRSPFKPEPRLTTWEPTTAWPAYLEEPKPADQSAPTLFAWALKTSLARTQIGQSRPTDDLAEVLLGIDRKALPEPSRSMFDALIADLLFQANRRSDLRAWIAAIPPGERSPTIRRWNETLVMVDLPLAVARQDFARARALWSELIAAKIPVESKQHATGLVGRLANSPVRRQDWLEWLRLTLKNHATPPDGDLIKREIRKVEESFKR